MEVNKMKFGRLGFFRFGSPGEQPQPQTPQETSVPRSESNTLNSGTGNNNTIKDNSSNGESSGQNNEQSNPENKSKGMLPPKRVSLFQGLKDVKDKKDEVKIFSSLDSKFALPALRTLMWVQENGAQLINRPGIFYRFIGYDRKTKERTHWLFIRGDVPTYLGKYRVVVDKFGHDGPGSAKYYNDPRAIEEFVESNYGIPADEIKLNEVDKNLYRDNLVKHIQETSDVKGAIAKIISANKEDVPFLSNVIKSALKVIDPYKVFDVISYVEEKKLPIDLSKEKEEYSKYADYTNHKDKYREVFNEEVAMPTKDPRVVDLIKKLLVATDSNDPKYIELLNKTKESKTEIINLTNEEVEIEDILGPNNEPLKIAAYDITAVPSAIAKKSKVLEQHINAKSVRTNEITGVTIDEFTNFLNKINANNELITKMTKRITGLSSVFVVPITNTSKKKIVISDTTPEITIKPGQTSYFTSVMARKSADIQTALKDGSTVIDQKLVKKRYSGGIDKEGINKTLAYFKKSVESYERFKAKNIPAFEYNMKMYTNGEGDDPSFPHWRNSGPGTFKVQLNLGMYTPAPTSEIINDHNHFREQNALVFSFVHEVMKDGKKIWVIDEFQSDLVQKLDQMSDNPGPITPANPKGLSPRKLYMSKTNNYYENWYRVAMNLIIKKAKLLNVDEIWMIDSLDIYEDWHNHSYHGESDDLSREKQLRLWRRVYDGTSMDFAPDLNNPEMIPLKKKYDELYAAMNRYYDSASKVDNYEILTKPEDKLTPAQKERKTDKFDDLTDEEKQRKLEGINIEQAKADIANINIIDLKNELEKVKSQVMETKEKTKEFPVEMRAGKYHVINVKKFPDEKLASIEKDAGQQLTKYATDNAKKYKEWGERAYNWIVGSWTPSYLRLAKEGGEIIMSEDQQKVSAMYWFWVREIPYELKTDSKLLVAIRTYLRERFNMPNLEWAKDVKLYVDPADEVSEHDGFVDMRLVVEAWDNPDPSAEDSQTSPMEESFSNRAVDQNSVLYRGKKGRGYPMGDPSGEGQGELKCNLPASVERTATDVVENYLVRREKEHATEPQIKKELEQKGLTPSEIADEYKNRSKNLYKETL
jgi:hypothetical protein